MNFLRHRIPQPPEVPSSRFRRRRTTQPDDDFELIHGDEPPNLRTLAVEGRIPIIRRRREEANNVPDYGASISNYRSLYGWAPGSEEEQIQQGNEFLSGFDDHSWYSRSSEQYNDPVELGVRQSRQEESAQNLSSLTPYPFARSTNTTRAVDSIPPSESLLHSVRRGQRFSRSRPLQNYILDRERTGQETEERERTTPVLTQRPYRYLPNAARDPYRNLTHGDLRARVNAHRQIYSENPPSARLKEAIKYLERIRFSHSPEENFSSAVESGCIQPSDAPRKLDFILDTISIRPPTECSWLRPGSVFSGSQRAAHALGSQMLAHRLSDSNQASDPVIVNGSESGRISVSTTSGRRYWAANSGHPAGSSGKEENWPVRVTIHDVNFSNMTLAGTMEAYNIPDKTNLNKDAHIITFLEGEIIDFNTYTLETKSFRADVEIDSTYWRELQPFKGMTDEEMAKKLVTRKWVTEELVKGWILMRWKGSSWEHS